MAATVASSTQTYGTSPPLTCTKPSGTTSGDLLVMICYGKWNTGFNASCTGFTQRISTNNGGEGMTVLSRLADGTEGASFSVTNGQTEIMGVIILRCTGVQDVWTVTNSQNNVTNGVFTTADITPTDANSLLIFAAWNVPYSASDITGYAIVTSNPSWTEAQEIVGNNGNAIGPCGVAWAVRPETSASGDFSITDPGADQQCCVMAIPPSADAFKRLALLGVG